MLSCVQNSHVGTLRATIHKTVLISEMHSNCLLLRYFAVVDNTDSVGWCAYRMLVFFSAHAVLPSDGHCEGTMSFTHSPVK